MITCLSNYFGLRNIETYESPVSGRYINELPGFKTEILQEVRDSEDTIEQAWSNIYTRANNLFEQDIMNAMKRYFKRYQIIDTTVTSDLETSDQLTSSSDYVGWMLDTHNWSRNTKLVIEKVNFFLSTAQNGTLRIFDLWTGVELYSKAFTGSVGINQVIINQEFATYKYNLTFICYDASEIQPFKLSDFNFAGYNIETRQKVSKSASVVKANISASDCGLSVSYNMKCSVDNFVCQRLSLFSEAFLYKLGIEFLKECKYSSELNRYTLLDMEEKDAQIDEFKEDYKIMMDNTLEDLNMRDDDICFHCNKGYTKKILIP